MRNETPHERKKRRIKNGQTKKCMEEGLQTKKNAYEKIEDEKAPDEKRLWN